MFGLLEDHSDPRCEEGRRPAEGPFVLCAFGQCPVGAHFACELGNESGQGERRRRLAGAVGSDDADRLAGSDLERVVGGRRHPRPWPGRTQPLSGEHRPSRLAGSQRSRLTRGSAGAGLGHPDPGGPEHLGEGGITEDRGRRSLRDDPTAAEDDDGVDVVRPQAHPVLDDDHRRRGGRLDREHRVPDRGRRGGVDVRRRFVEDDDLGCHRVDAGECEALLLAPGECGRGVVEGQVEAERCQGGGDALVDDFGAHPDVLHSEGDVVADAGEDHLRIGVLEDEPGHTSARIRWGVTDHELSSGLTRFDGEDTRDRVEQCRLPRP
ncbi:Uncharacterised protein [Mycobacteroides abscessus subsp. abscessus]|nr:Uncharacterised protein [Mycobacteroides abscessus subsp. abscessus]